MPRKSGKIPLSERLRELEESIQSRSKFFSHLSASILAFVVVLVVSQFELHSLGGLLVDGLLRASGTRQPSDKIALIAYDDASRVRFEGGSEIPAQELAAVLEALSDEKPAAVLVLHSLSEKNYTPSELALIGKRLTAFDHPFVGYLDEDAQGKNPPPSLGNVPYLPGFVSRDTFSYGADSVSRRVMVTIQSTPTVYAEVAKTVAGHSTFRNVYELGSLGDSAQVYTNWQGPPGTYPLVPTRDVAEGLFEPGAYTGKVVLIGRALKSKSAEDYIFTPYSRGHLQTPTLEAAAHGLVTLMQNRGLFRPSHLVSVLITILVSLLTVNLVLSLPPWRGILFTLGEILLIVGFAWVGVGFFGIWIDMAHPLIICCIGYYMVIPYRLVDESRKRWHYQEQSELMAQLEQLKTNFLSLVSHDLKTPIARIQGKAELLLGEENSSLTEAQRNNLSAIVQTTDNLGQYVETVLDLTRIESARVPLQRTSKDINSVIQEVLESKRGFASEKAIELKADLEPMFSFKFDVRLMKRVLSNLVENAIKYSPEGTVITLSSQEKDNWIHVSVNDQGLGISEEDQERVFGKFYRCQRSQEADAKGTGLGLYLVKYFVELHKGAVNLKSELGKGSTFTVSLPVS